MRHILLFLIAIISFSQTSLAQEISMFPGFFQTKYYEDDTRISKSQVETLLAQNDEANMLWQKSKTHLTIGVVALVAELGFAFWGSSKADKNESTTVPLIGVLGSAAACVGFSLSSSNLKKDAILKYNASKDVGSIKIGPTYNGVGIVVGF